MPRGLIENTLYFAPVFQYISISSGYWKAVSRAICVASASHNAARTPHRFSSV